VSLKMDPHNDRANTQEVGGRETPKSLPWTGHPRLRGPGYLVYGTMSGGMIPSVSYYSMYYYSY